MSSPEEAQLEQALRGEASKVYWLLLRSNSPMDAYEIQRQLRYKSTIPTIQRHLEELRSLGLAEKHEPDNSYVAASQVKTSILRSYVGFGRLLFPRYLAYALLATTFYFAFVLFFIERVSRENLLVGFFGAIFCIVLWYEAYRFWSGRPY